MPGLWKVDKDLVKRVAENARLQLTEEEIEKFSHQLTDILEAFKEIDQVDVTDIEPSFHPQEIKDVWRDDKASKWQWNPLYASRHKEKRYFKGPRIV